MSIDERHTAPGVNPDEFRRALGRFATGVTLVTAGGNRPHGMTANAFVSVSLDPPLILVCVKNSARLNETIIDAGTFGVSILSSEQRDVAVYFSRRDRPDGSAQFDAFDFYVGPITSVPLLDGALSQLECEVFQTLPCGDHYIYIGRVLGCSARKSGSPLTYYSGAFTVLPTPP